MRKKKIAAFNFDWKGDTKRTVAFLLTLFNYIMLGVCIVCFIIGIVLNVNGLKGRKINEDDLSMQFIGKDLNGENGINGVKIIFRMENNTKKNVKSVSGELTITHKDTGETIYYEKNKTTKVVVSKQETVEGHILLLSSLALRETSFSKMVIDYNVDRVDFDDDTYKKTSLSYSKDNSSVCPHRYVSTITQPTCTEQGYTTHTCSLCDDTYIDAYTVAKGHTEETVESEIPATCTETGVMAKIVCSECGVTLQRRDTIPAKGHTEVVDAAVPATCTETGLTEGKHCSVCDAVLIAQRTVSAMGHNYNAVITEPTCTEQGYTTHTCSLCDDTYIDAYTVAKGHTEVVDAAVPATCTETGLTEGKHCSVCDAVLIAQRTVSAMGHNYNAVITEPTESEEGYTMNTCSHCGLDYVSDYVSAPKGRNLTYEMIDDTYFVTGYTGSPTEIIIPSKHLGIIVTSIGNYAFYGCSSLTSITIPARVTSIGYEAFRYCDSLTSVCYTGDIASWCGITFGDFYSNPLIYAHNLYINNEIISGEIVLPNTVTQIPNYTFRNSNITSITIPDSVTSIGNSAFSGCRSLTSVTLGNSVTSIGGSAFYSCSNLKSITIPDSVTSIGSNAFYECSSLTSITIPDSVTSIGEKAFYNCSSLTSITIGNSVTSIGNSVFRDCNSLTSITIPDSVTSIGDDAFYNCPIETATIPTLAISYIPKSNLKTVVITSGESIGGSAFEYCSKLTSITIPDSVTSIGDYAFDYCSSLTSVYYTGDIASWCGITFSDEYSNPLIYAHNLYIDNELIKEIVIPDTVTEIGYQFVGWNGTSITIPDGVTSIGSYAFFWCSSLTSITLPDSVTSIGERAFSGCYGLTSITVDPKNPKYHSAGNCLIETATKKLIAGCKNSVIPTDDNVTSIGSYAFFWCSSLTSITIPDSVTSIGEYAFSGCSSLSSITIPDSVTSIGDDAFSSCYSLTSITISDSVTSLGEHAFSGCSSLSSIAFQGTKAQWNAINKEYGWDSYTDSYTIYCTDGMIRKE